ncbi:MAG TPA: aldehyde dehydrogenase family protein [Frankiaceae bacterium]|jgi:acyl-CoA reductase-like NAD-dependent aldehyde dehydrogenase|nr:aldehyde dehydrogenase family protein [Frankiaceae bacterium]
MSLSVEPGRLLVDGEWVEPAGGHYDVVNPATEEVVGQAPEASVQQALDAAASAKQAFKTWSRTTPEHRAAILDRVADLLVKHGEEIIPLLQAETGATMRVASTMQVPVAINRFRRYARDAMLSDTIPLPPTPMNATALAPGGLIGAVVVRQPVGVVACITSYNFPLVNLAGKMAPALAMGNTVIAKPAPQDPLHILRFGELLMEAGIPPGVVNIIGGSGAAAGAALTTSPDVDMVSFTGSTAVGRNIATACGDGMKRQLLELGGKGAAIVFEDGDVDLAVTGISSTWTFHSGQICTAPTRVLVHRSKRDELIGKLSGLAGALKVGDPLAPDTVVGPVISGVQRGRVEAAIAEATSAGAELVAGGGRPDLDKGFFVKPTLLAGVAPGSPAAQNEFFGPVVVVLTFDDEDEAIELANGTPYGLYDYVYTADAARGYQLARQLRTGLVGVNTSQRNNDVPFGGFKMSGVGRDGGVYGLHAYSELQSIVWPS